MRLPINVSKFYRNSPSRAGMFGFIFFVFTRFCVFKIPNAIFYFLGHIKKKQKGIYIMQNLCLTCVHNKTAGYQKKHPDFSDIYCRAECGRFLTNPMYMCRNYQKKQTRHICQIPADIKDIFSDI